jgi:hypothetical protein
MTTLVIALFLNLAFLYAESVDKPITFLWALIYRDNTGEIVTIDPVKAEAKLSSKDKFKIFIKPVENAYVYLFLLDAQGSLSLVFPEYLDFFRQGYTWGVSYNIPEVDDWLYVDEMSGTEEFYLLASGERLTKLEQLTTAYKTQVSMKQKDTERLALAQKLVLDEIKRLRLERFNMQSPAEKPVPVAVNFRGVGKLIEILATEVKASGFYAKTILLVH